LGWGELVGFDLVICGGKCGALWRGVDRGGAGGWVVILFIIGLFLLLFFVGFDFAFFFIVGGAWRGQEGAEGFSAIVFLLGVGFFLFLAVFLELAVVFEGFAEEGVEFGLEVQEALFGGESRGIGLGGLEGLGQEVAGLRDQGWGVGVGEGEAYFGEVFLGAVDAHFFAAVEVAFAFVFDDF